MADNRQFTDHNEIGGVNVYLEDKKLAESPEKNTVASTDYVLLKDTDGVPQKISKANLMGVVKDALADLLRGNDLGTSVTNVPALGTNTFGSATVANLASVLGVASGSSCIYNGGSMNDGRLYKYSGGRFSGTLYVNNNNGAVGIFNITKTSNGSISIRKALQSSNSNLCYFFKDNDGAIYVQHSQTWGSHTLIASLPNIQQGYVTSTEGLTSLTVTDGTFYNDYNDLSSLATALGVNNWNSKGVVATDANALYNQPNGLYMFKNTPIETSHTPATWGWLLNFKGEAPDSGYRCMQLFINTNNIQDVKLSYRGLFNDEWISWKAIQFT